MHIFKDTKFDFLRWRWYAFGLTTAIILAGAYVERTRGIPLGIEFSGGTSVILKFDRAVSDEQVRSALASNYPGGAEDTIVQAYGEPATNQKMIRVPEVGAEKGDELTVRAEQVQSAVRKANLGNFTLAGTEVVSPSVGAEIARKGLWATALSLIGILLYIAFRFQLSFAVGAVIATVHDLLIMLAFLAFFQYDLSLNVIAAILAITGFSTNDTIVIFDRVREDLRSMRRDSLNHVINVAVNQTLGRTVITSGTALLSALALFFFGGDVLHGFAFTMIVGIITGTYSSVFIASAVVSLWRGQGPTRAATHAPAMPGAPAQTPTQAQQPTRKGKPARNKARAS